MPVTPQPPPLLRGTKIVERLLGYWPSFHDAEVLSVYLDRVGVSMTLHLLMPSVPPIPADASSVQIAMRFDGVRDLTIDDLNHQNVIMVLTFSEITERRFNTDAEETRLRVEMETVFGMSCSFSCAGGEIVGVTLAPSRPPIVPFRKRNSDNSA